MSKCIVKFIYFKKIKRLTIYNGYNTFLQLKKKTNLKRPSAASELGAVGGPVRDRKKAQGTEEPSLAWTEEPRQRGPIYIWAGDSRMGCEPLLKIY
jgi:hypothetical protein